MSKITNDGLTWSATGYNDKRRWTDSKVSISDIYIIWRPNDGAIVLYSKIGLMWAKKCTQYQKFIQRSSLNAQTMAQSCLWALATMWVTRIDENESPYTVTPRSRIESTTGKFGPLIWTSALQNGRHGRQGFAAGRIVNQTDGLANLLERDTTVHEDDVNEQRPQFSRYDWAAVVFGCTIHKCATFFNFTNCALQPVKIYITISSLPLPRRCATCSVCASELSAVYTQHNSQELA